MTIHIINPYKDIDPQIEEVIATAASSDEVEITEEIDFQSALADVEDGLYESIEEALHEKFLGTGVPYAPYFEFKEVTSPTSLTIRYVTGVQGLQKN